MAASAAPPGSRDVAVGELIQAVSDLLAAERRLRDRDRRRTDAPTNRQLRAIQTLLRRGVATPSQLAEAAEVSRSTMTAMLNSLHAKGVIERRPGAGDRRTVEVVLTDKGRALPDDAEEAWRRRWEAALGGIPCSELGTAVRVIQAVTSVVEDG